jgi:hypothetical protein
MYSTVEPISNCPENSNYVALIESSKLVDHADPFIFISIRQTEPCSKIKNEVSHHMESFDVFSLRIWYALVAGLWRGALDVSHSVKIRAVG